MPSSQTKKLQDKAVSERQSIAYETFGYDMASKQASGLVTGVLFTFAAIDILDSNVPTKLGGAIVILLVVLLCFFFVLTSLFQFADMTIDAQGLSWSVFSRTWRRVSWSEICLIRIDHIPDMRRLTDPINQSAYWFLPTYARNPEEKRDQVGCVCARYTISTAPPRSSLMPIRFTEKIMDFQRARALINVYVLEHNIRVVKNNNGTDSVLPSLS